MWVFESRGKVPVGSTNCCAEHFAGFVRAVRESSASLSYFLSPPRQTLLTCFASSPTDLAL
jgi:hypothetical protein